MAIQARAFFSCPRSGPPPTPTHTYSHACVHSLSLNFTYRSPTSSICGRLHFLRSCFCPYPVSSPKRPQQYPTDRIARDTNLQRVRPELQRKQMRRWNYHILSVARWFTAEVQSMRGTTTLWWVKGSSDSDTVQRSGHCSVRYQHVYRLSLVMVDRRLHSNEHKNRSQTSI